MSGSYNALQITDPNDYSDNPLYSGTPSQGEALGSTVSTTVDRLSQWLAEQRAKSSQMGLWNDRTGLPTSAGLVNAARQYGNAILMGSTAPKATPSVLYHVAGEDWQPGQSLQSLYNRYGDDAYAMYAERWPEAGDLSQYHPHMVMFYDNLADAQDHPTDGTLLQIDPKKVPGLRFDKLESPGFWATNEDVPAEAITPVSDK